MAFDTFVGLPADQSVAGAAWDSGGQSWNAATTLVGTGANAVKSTTSDPFQITANYAALAGEIGQAIFFKFSSAPPLGDFMGFAIDANGGLDSYGPSAAVRANVGSYNTLTIRDVAAGREVTTPFTISVNTDYCLELVKTANANNREYKATVYAASAGVRGAVIATVTITVDTELLSRRVALWANAYIRDMYSISRVESIAASASTAPLLQNPTGTATSSTTGTATASTDTGGGIMYYLTLAAASAVPSASTIKSSGASQTVSATGTRTLSVTSLAAGTAYRTHIMQELGDGTQSNVVSTPSYSTPAPDSIAPTFSNGAAITPGTITSTSLAGSGPAATDNVGVVGYEVSKDGGANWIDNGTGLNFSFNGLPSSTTHLVMWRARDFANNRSVALQLSMTTAAAASGAFTTEQWLSSGTLRANQPFTGTWYSGGTPGSAGGTATLVSGTLNAAARAVLTGLPIGPGFLIGATSDGGRYYQAGTVA